MKGNPKDNQKSMGRINTQLAGDQVSEPTSSCKKPVESQES